MMAGERASGIRHHLDKAAQTGGYLDAINGTTPESLVDATMKMAPFVAALEFEEVPAVVSLGVGQGEELHALRHVLGDNTPIIGMDLSREALNRSIKRSAVYELNAGHTMADASNLPFQAESLGGVVLSAVLHEVYSYNEPDGKTAWENCVADASRALMPGGVLYVRDFATPRPEEGVRLVTRSRDAAHFLEFFREHFTIGLGEEGNGLDIIAADGSLGATGNLTQVMMHYRNFWNDRSRGNASFDDVDWKELRESYLVPSTRQPNQYMDPTEYCEEVVSTALVNEQELALATLHVRNRRKTNLFLEDHFYIVDGNGHDATKRLMTQATAKMEAVFQKI